MRQLQMIYPEQAEEGRVQIVHMNRILSSMVSQFIGRSIAHASLDAASSEEH